MIKYINIQNALCPVCAQDTSPKISKCTPLHLEEIHNIRIESVQSITKDVLELTKLNRYDVDPKHRMTRNQILECAKERIKPNLKRLKEFLKSKGFL